MSIKKLSPSRANRRTLTGEHFSLRGKNKKGSRMLLIFTVLIQPPPMPRPEPQPVPVPQPQPVPVPGPQPVPGPAPQPVPVPQPQPTPVPNPQPVPAPTPRPPDSHYEEQ